MSAHVLVALHCTDSDTRGRSTARLSFLQSSLESAGGPGAHTLSWTATAGVGRSTSGTYNMVRPRDVWTVSTSAAMKRCSWPGADKNRGFTSLSTLHSMAAHGRLFCTSPCSASDQAQACSNAGGRCGGQTHPTAHMAGHACLSSSSCRSVAETMVVSATDHGAAPKCQHGKRL